jgi:hypothetical protein
MKTWLATPAPLPSESSIGAGTGRASARTDETAVPEPLDPAQTVDSSRTAPINTGSNVGQSTTPGWVRNGIFTGDAGLSFSRSTIPPVETVFERDCRRCSEKDTSLVSEQPRSSCPATQLGQQEHDETPGTAKATAAAKNYEQQQQQQQPSFGEKGTARKHT